MYNYKKNNSYLGADEERNIAKYRKYKGMKGKCIIESLAENDSILQEG